MRFFGITDIGKSRKENQDGIFICDDFENIKYFIIADGMGGVNGGKVASTIAIDSVVSYIERHIYDIVLDEDSIKGLLKDAILDANTAVYKRSLYDENYRGMGTTLIIAFVYGNRIYIGHVGDSRLYRIRKNIIRQLTKDHSYVQALLDEGTITKYEAENHPQKNMLLKVIGCEESVEPDIIVKGFIKDDVILMCTDGLTNMISVDDIYNIVVTEKYDIESACKKLISAANASGGYDNVSTILISKD